MSETNFFGLCKEAKEFLKQNQSSKNPIAKLENGIPITYGLFDEFILYKYILKNGIAEEFIQSINNWSDGPLIFLGLSIRIFGKKYDIKWSKEEINEIVERMC